MSIVTLFPQLGIALFTFAVIGIVGFIVWRLAFGEIPPLGDAEKPIHTLIGTWVSLWSVTAVILMGFTFPHHGRTLPQVQPPHLVSQPTTVVAIADPSILEEESSAPDTSTAAIALLQSNGCNACHTISGASGMVGTVGPELTHIATEAESRIADSTYTGSATTVNDYLHESILTPGVYIANGYTNVMPPSFGQTIAEDDLNIIITYLEGLR